MIEVSAQSAINYPVNPPFDPSEVYPEYRGRVGTVPNTVYRGVRGVLLDLFPQGDQYGVDADWNPLSSIIKPGDNVFIKPNLVDHEHRYLLDPYSVISHPSVIRAVLDYVILALDGNGRVLIGDNPHVDADWSRILELLHADEILNAVSAYTDIPVKFVDCRNGHIADLADYGFKEAVIPLPGDPAGASEVIVTKSLLDAKNRFLFRGTFNERRETIAAHRPGRHIYTFSRSMYDSDAFISIPKLKTHAKVGMTVNLKGLIGTIANKNQLVHWCIGYPRFGGDEYPPPASRVDYLRLYLQHAYGAVTPSWFRLRMRRAARRLGISTWTDSLLMTESQKLRYLRGSWQGNDTTWRMTADVYRAFVGAARSQRRVLSVVDGVVGGDTDGPHFPHPVAAGVVLGGTNLALVDVLAAEVVGFKWQSIRYLKDVVGSDPRVGAVVEYARNFASQSGMVPYRPPHRWDELSRFGIGPGAALRDPRVL